MTFKYSARYFVFPTIVLRPRESVILCRGKQKFVERYRAEFAPFLISGEVVRRAYGVKAAAAPLN